MNMDAKPKQDTSKTNLMMYLKDQIGFSPGMQSWFINRKFINLIHHFSKSKEKTILLSQHLQGGKAFKKNTYLAN